LRASSSWKEALRRQTAWPAWRCTQAAGPGGHPFTQAIGLGGEALHRVREPAVTQVPGVQEQAKAVIISKVVPDHLLCNRSQLSTNVRVGDKILYNTDDQQHADILVTNLSLYHLVHNIGNRDLQTAVQLVQQAESPLTENKPAQPQDLATWSPQTLGLQARPTATIAGREHGIWHTSIPVIQELVKLVLWKAHLTIGELSHCNVWKVDKLEGDGSKETGEEQQKTPPVIRNVQQTMETLPAAGAGGMPQPQMM
jgi:hypothetical protein